jgi:hypothetical protein
VSRYITPGGPDDKGGPVYHDVATKSYRDALGNTLATKMDRLNQNPNWQAVKDRVWTGEAPASVQHKWARVDGVDAPPEPLDRLQPGQKRGEFSPRERATTVRILWGSPDGRQRSRIAVLEHAMRYGHRIPLNDISWTNFKIVYYDTTKVPDPVPFMPPQDDMSQVIMILHLTDIEYAEPADPIEGTLDERRRPVLITLNKEAPVANRRFGMDKKAQEVPPLYYDDMSRVYRDAFGTQYATHEDQVADSTRWKTVKDQVRDTVPADVLSRWADDGGNNLEGSTLPSISRPDPDKGPGVADKGQPIGAEGRVPAGSPERAKVTGECWYVQFERPEKDATNWIGPFGTHEHARRWIAQKPSPPLPETVSVTQVPAGGFVVHAADRVFTPEQYWKPATAPRTLADALVHDIEEAFPDLKSASAANLNRALERPFGNWFIFVGDAKPWGPFDYQWEATRTAGNWLGTGDYTVKHVPAAVVLKDISPEQKRDLIASLSESRMVPLRETPGSAEWVRENMGHIERTILMPQVQRAVEEHTERALAQHVEAFHRTRDTAVQGLVNRDIKAGGPTRHEGEKPSHGGYPGDFPGGEVPGPKDHLRAWPSLEGDVDPRVFSSLMVTNPYRAWLLLNRFTPFGDVLKALMYRDGHTVDPINAAVIEAAKVAMSAGVTQKTAQMCQTRIINALLAMPNHTLGDIMASTATPVPEGSAGSGAPGWYFQLQDAPFPTYEYVGPFVSRKHALDWLSRQPVLKIGEQVVDNYLSEYPNGILAKPGDRITPWSVFKGVQ